MDDPFPPIAADVPEAAALATVTLPVFTWKVVLSALMWYGKRLYRRGDTSEKLDFVGLRHAADAAATIGETIGSGEHRIFRFKELTRND